MVAASGRSAGKLYEEAVDGRWKMTAPMPEFVKKMTVYDMDKDFDEIVSKVDFVFCAVNMPKDEIKVLEENMQRQKCRLYLTTAQTAGHRTYQWWYRKSTRNT